MPMIKMTARKALGAALHEARNGKNPALTLRRLEDFKDAAGPEHCEKVKQTLAALDSQLRRAALHWADIENDIQALIGLMPAHTYGEIPAGTKFKVMGSSYFYIKRKWGIDVVGRSEMLGHFFAYQTVIPLED